MRNALLPTVSPHLYDFEMSMVLAFIWTPKSSMMATSYEMEASVFLINPLLAINQVHNIPQQSTLLSERVSIAEVQMDFQAMQTRKRSIDELTNLLPQKEPSDLIENKTALSTWKRKTNKRKKANSPEEPWNHQARESISIQEQKLQVPVRRSQKLSDKITALQKLVSSYGKADTASVLLEASLHIKLLQEQIQNLFQMLTSSCDSTRPIQQSQANAASGMAVHDDCKLRFLDLKAKRTYRFIVFKIEEKQKQVIVEKLGEPADSYENFSASLPADECRYAVYDFDYVTEENCQKSRIVFIAWCPDTARVRSKMIYASSKDRFKRELDGIQIELQATDPTEMGLDVIRSRSN
ncbi:hypothetical protein H0E87_019720 [Populus deltoides]|uniref:ADF-H domain-containing protein n=1 Tax=Populus deltoides TaxID=3696 RepID=A0A8T2XW96_POPDE|nr:hypothetical protein H0E87_019720 [Populus deltoides]